MCIAEGEVNTMAAFEYLANYVTFESVAHMDEHIEQHMQVHYYSLTDSERAIVFKMAAHALEYPGACHLKASTIADSLEISTKTVYRALKKLVALGIVRKETTVKPKGGQGANIYVILPCNELQEEMHTEAATVEVSPIVQSGMTIGAVQERYEAVHNEKQSHQAYMNEFQKMLYDLMYSLPLPDVIKDELHKIVMAAQVQSIKEFVVARDVVWNIANDIKSGTLTVTKTIRSIFVGAYNKAIERRNNTSHRYMAQSQQAPHRANKVQFYDWLRERHTQEVQI